MAPGTPALRVSRGFNTTHPPKALHLPSQPLVLLRSRIPPTHSHPPPTHSHPHFLPLFLLFPPCFSAGGSRSVQAPSNPTPQTPHWGGRTSPTATELRGRGFHTPNRGDQHQRSPKAASWQRQSILNSGSALSCLSFPRLGAQGSSALLEPQTPAQLLLYIYFLKGNFKSCALELLQAVQNSPRDPTRKHRPSGSTT